MSRTHRLAAIFAADVTGTQCVAAGNWRSCAFN